MAGGGAAAGAGADGLSGRLAALDLGSVPGASGGGSGSGDSGGGSGSGGGTPWVAGLEAPLQALRELVGWPLRYAAEAAALGVAWPRGLLLHGPPGCGKTSLVRQVADEFGATLHPVSASSVFGAYVGESERRLRDAFAAASADAAAGRLAVVFLDEADALAPRRGGGGQHEARVVAQLVSAEGKVAAAAAAAARGRVVVVAATNRPGSLDPALRRPGRLDREVAVPVPGPDARAAVLRLHTAGLSLAADVDLAALAAGCHGYSGADLAALAREAAMSALSAAAAAAAAASSAGAEGGAAGGGFSGGGGGCAGGVVSAADFDAAARRVGPSIVRGQALELPPIAWADIGGYEGVKRRLQQAVEWPLRHAGAFARLGLAPPRGVLLHGPPGCSKTMLARAAAAASGATFLPLSCAQLYSMYVGEGEAALRDTFARARLAAPGEDGGGEGGGPDVAARLLSTLLTELDGLEASRGVLLLAATNRPGALDAALLRPGRLDVLLYVGPPDAAGRLETLRIHTRPMPLAPDVDLDALAADTAGFTGAEVAEAALAALREDIDGAAHVASRHFAAARAAAAPALTFEQLAAYEAWGLRYRR
ncbi:MAG: P-loop containing nucleoside triphosphate hydrolase protein [Monoraphidium minutum]|nr:MAG: P-loop containing nucleoside triphosphate hydrolase protein [Monoraphidium minutum]